MRLSPSSTPAERTGFCGTIAAAASIASCRGTGTSVPRRGSHAFVRRVAPARRIASPGLAGAGAGRRALCRRRADLSRGPDHRTLPDAARWLTRSPARSCPPSNGGRSARRSRRFIAKACITRISMRTTSCSSTPSRHAYICSISIAAAFGRAARGSRSPGAPAAVAGEDQSTAPRSAAFGEEQWQDWLLAR